MFVCRSCKCVYMSRRSWFYVCMFFLYVYSGMYVYMSDCLCIYVFICLQVRREREREGDKSLRGNLIAQKNVTCFHDPIIFILANRFWPSALINCPLNIGKQNVKTEDDNNFYDVLSMLFRKLNFRHLSSYHIKNYQDFLQKKN